MREKPTRQKFTLAIGAFAFLLLLFFGAAFGPYRSDYQSSGVLSGSQSGTDQAGVISETQTISFDSEAQDDPSMLVGETKLQRAGVVGQRIVQYQVTFENGAKRRQKIGERTVIEPIDKVVFVGTLRTETATPEAIPFTTEYVDDTTVLRGTFFIRQAGVNGEKAEVYSVGFVRGEEVERSFLSEVVLREPTPEIIVNGTDISGCNPNYSGCVPNVSKVKCAGETGPGPSVVGPLQVIGYDVYGLDPDGNDLACD